METDHRVNAFHSGAVLKTPVAIFIFNRPDLTERVFVEIRRARPVSLLVIADGPRKRVASDRRKCGAARAAATAVDWPCTVRTNFSSTNLGCQKRMASGLDWVFRECRQAIVLEDDCLPHPDFFAFCDQMLRRYRDEPKVMQISGTNVQEGQSRTRFSYYFSRYNHVWGWATWRRAWRLYDVKATGWEKTIWSKRYRKIFTGNAERRLWHNLFHEVTQGRVDTWDCQWFLTILRAGAFTITPDVNLISNLGFRRDATHTRLTRPGKPTAPLGNLKNPSRIRWCKRADHWYMRQFLAQHQRWQKRNEAG